MYLQLWCCCIYFFLATLIRFCSSLHKSKVNLDFTRVIWKLSCLQLTVFGELTRLFGGKVWAATIFVWLQLYFVRWTYIVFSITLSIFFISPVFSRDLNLKLIFSTNLFIELIYSCTAKCRDWNQDSRELSIFGMVSIDESKVETYK